VTQNRKILVFGATGMLGSTIYNYIAMRHEFIVLGAHRLGRRVAGLIQNEFSGLVQCEFDQGLLNATALIQEVKPIAVINCIGVIKQRPEASEVLATVPINTVLPHQLHAACAGVGAKFIHFSTDCVFSGTKGNYTEDAQPDAVDVYGLSKYLGEVVSDGALTLRTSIIGHELSSSRSLLEWFLSQDGQVKGYTNAYFSGIPTNEVARVTLNIIKFHPGLSGLYHLASDKISKYDLLMRLNKAYEKNLDIVPDGTLKIDRSLNAKRLTAEIGYEPPSWEMLIAKMKGFRDERDRYFQR
jgi:dTDP-4-dehydrorhamnose reductase